MPHNVDNPDHYMASLRQIIAQGRKRIGLLVGAGAPAGVKNPATGKPLIPAVAELTKVVLTELEPEYETVINILKEEIKNHNIESILSRIRSLSTVIGSATVHGLNAPGYDALGKRICDKIGEIVNKDLFHEQSPYSDFVTWISGTDRLHPIEIFTTNYDLLFEQALEYLRAPFFDGFTGSREPFFDPATVANDDLPPRWTRLWKLHGSLGWKTNERGEVTRSGDRSFTHLVFPEHHKYDQTQKAPYSALFDRLRSFLMTKDTLLISTGFSYADAHISARIDECLAANASTSVFAFQFKKLDDEKYAREIASRNANMSLYSPDQAMINGIAAPWQPGDLPTTDWGPIRATYWGSDNASGPAEFQLGKFDKLARFFASSRTTQHDQVPLAIQTDSIVR